MKKTMILILCLALALSLATAAVAAESSVTFEGGAEDFVFVGAGSENAYTDTDLFLSFKDMMPGDSRQQEITVKNTSRDSDYVKLYLHALLHAPEENDPVLPAYEAPWDAEDQAAMDAFLACFHLEVKQGDKTLFSGKANELDGLESRVLLGVFRRGDKTTLTATLSLPMEAGNEAAYGWGEVDWVFSVEEFDDPDTPKTGDDSPIGLYVALVVLCAAAIVLVLVRRKKRAE